MHSGVTHERCADFRHGKKPQKRGEFITPPRPTGRRSNYHRVLSPCWFRQYIGIIVIFNRRIDYVLLVKFRVRLPNKDR